MTPEVRQSVQNILNLIVLGIDPEAKIDLEKEGDQWRISIESHSKNDLVGDKGEILRSIQHYLRIAIHKHFPSDKSHFLIDINKFRNTRELKIKNQLPDIVRSTVIEQGKTVVLIGLSGYERMIVHQLFSDIKGLSTNSVGADNARKLLIMPTSEFGSTGMDEAVVWDISKN